MNLNNIKEVEKRTLSYWFEDGIWDLAFGLVLFLLGIFYFLGVYFQFEQKFGMIFSVIQMLVVIFAFLGVGKLVKFLKERFTYPRTGFVHYRKPNKSQNMKRMLTSFITALVVSSIIAAASSMPAMQNKVSIIAGLALGLSTLYLGWRFDVPRYFLIALASILLGLGLSFADFTPINSIAVFFGSNGLIWMFAGGVAFGLYLRHSQRVADTLLDDEKKEIS